MWHSFPENPPVASWHPQKKVPTPWLGDSLHTLPAIISSWHCSQWASNEKTDRLTKPEVPGRQALDPSSFVSPTASPWTLGISIWLLWLSSILICLLGLVLLLVPRWQLEFIHRKNKKGEVNLLLCDSFKEQENLCRKLSFPCLIGRYFILANTIPTRGSERSNCNWLRPWSGRGFPSTQSLAA